MAKVLILDDDIGVAQMLEKMITSIGHEAEFELTLENGFGKASNNKYDVIFLDVHMPDGNGLELLKQLRALPDAPEVIIMTGLGNPDGAELAIKSGAWDYIQKPLSPKKIIQPIKQMLQYRDNLKASKQSPVVLSREDIIGHGAKIEACLQQVAKAAAGEANVLITGETGTGKELFAKTLHANSKRRVQNMVVVDCGALPETLVESQLFGHEKGAFTGAMQSQKGLIKMADHGTLFLDEVCELSLPLQKAFLRVLQEKKFRPIGGKQEIHSDFRLISATNRDTEEMVRKGLFRKDLLYRLKTINIHLPPLRERVEDIKEMVLHFTELIIKRYALPPKVFSPDLLDILNHYSWPGNVRELMNILENAINTAGNEPILFSAHLPKQIRVEIARLSVQSEENSPTETQKPSAEPILPELDITGGLPIYKTFRESVLMQAEKVYFKRLMAYTDGSVKRACQVSGLGRTRLYTLLKKHGIKRIS